MERNSSSESFNIDRDAYRSEGGYIKLNKRLIKLFGLIPAALIGNYVEKDCYFNADKAGWFFLRHSDQIDQLNISEFTLRKSKSLLQEMGIIETKMQGVPAKEWYKINYKLLRTCKGLDPSETKGLGITETKGLLNKDKYNKNLDNKNKIFFPHSAEEEADFSSSNGYITPNIFEDFWSIFPKKADKGKALTNWLKLCKKGKNAPKWRIIRKAIMLQKETDRWQDPKFIPHPATWLNQSRWLDDPSEMSSFTRSEEQEEDDVYAERPLADKFKRRELDEYDI